MTALPHPTAKPAKPKGSLRRWLRSCAVALALAAASGPASAVFAQAGAETKPAVDERAVRRAVAELSKRIVAAEPGPQRYKDVDTLIEMGEPAWPAVRDQLAGLREAKEGEAIVVDLLLGFGATSYDDLIISVPSLGDDAARRIVKVVLRRPEDERQTRLLAAMVPRRDDEVLLSTLPVLMTRKHAAVVPRLIELVDDSRPRLAGYAIDTLGAGRHANALQPMIRLLGIEQRRATKENQWLRLKLIAAVGRIGGEAAVPPLMEAIGMPDQRGGTLDALSTVGQPAVQAALFLLRTATGERIATAAEVLSHLRLQAAPALVELLNAGDQRTRELATDLLAWLAVPEVRTEVVRMVLEERFVDPRDGIRLAATMYDESVRDMMLQIVEKSRDPELRVFVVEQLWRLRDPDTFRALRVLAGRDKQEEVRLSAVQAVAGSGDPNALPLLRKLVRETNRNVRIAALEALSRLDTFENAVPAIAPLLGDPNEKVFRAALAALRQLSFHTGPRREGQWNAWFRAETNREIPDWESLRGTVHKFDVDAHEMSYLEVGEGEKTIVVVSGPPFRDATHLVPHVYRLADDYRVVVMKRGASVYRGAEADLEQMSRELEALLRRLGSSQPVVLLADLSGAHFALRYSSSHRRDVSKVILHGGMWPTPEAIDRLPAQVQATISPIFRDDIQWAMQAKWRMLPRLRYRMVMRGLLSGLLANWEYGRRVYIDNVAVDAFEPEVLDRMRAEYQRFDPTKVRKPVLLLVGAKAPWAKTTIADVKALRGKIARRLQVVEIANAGWMPLLENPDAAFEAIENFLDD